MKYLLLFVITILNFSCGKVNDTSLTFPYQITIICGNSGNSCYDNSQAISYGFAKTPSGKELAYVDADGTGSRTFKIWIENVQSGTAKVLSANGMDAWQMQLNPNGRAHSTSYFAVNTSSNNVLLGTTLNLTGRVCPPNVFYDADGTNQATDFTNIGMCLYYVELPGSANHSLSEDGTDYINGLSAWNNASSGNGTGSSWYEGNVLDCNQYGMRLPTFYETNTTACPSGYGTWPNCTNLPTDASPTFATTNGVPYHTSGWPGAWTATAFVSGNPWSRYFVWRANDASYDSYSITSYYFVCVLP